MFITPSNSFFHSNLNSFSGRFVLFNKKPNKENTFYQEVVEKIEKIAKKNLKPSKKHEENLTNINW
jgi:hypothetical protein